MATLETAEVRRRRAARIITEVFAPTPTIGALFLLVAWHSAPTGADAVAWGGLTLLFAALIPFAYLLRQVRQRRVTDHHVRVRQQRPRILLAAIASTLTLLAVLIVFGAPRELTALVVACVAGLASALLVTLVWKISIHVAVVAGAIVILVLVFGRLLIVLAPLVALTAWARITLRDHTPAQVVGGGLLGAVVAGVVFTVLR